jgi:uncharacterized protein
MVNIDEMSAKEIRELLHKVGYGHLGFIYEGKPSVVSIHYYLEGADIYLFTTEGMKTYGMDVNPEICLQVEEVQGSLHWRSVMIEGRAEKITNKAEIDRIMQLIKDHNPWIDAWRRADVSSIYQISHYSDERKDDGWHQ